MMSVIVQGVLCKLAGIFVCMVMISMTVQGVLRKLAEMNECKVYSKFNENVTHVIMKTSEYGPCPCARPKFSLSLTVPPGWFIFHILPGLSLIS